MSFYKELQLETPQSVSMIKASKSKKEKIYHIAVLFFRVFITILFSILAITVFTSLFEEENRMAGVVILLSVLMFRNVDLRIKLSHSILSILIIYAVLIFAPHLANLACGIHPLIALPIHLVSIFAIALLGCRNLDTYNQFVVVLAYLLLYGYDVTGEAYLFRIAGLSAGTLLIVLIYFVKHKNKKYKETLKDVFKEFNIRSARTSWQIKLTLSLSTLLAFGELIGIPRIMWAGIAAMSVLIPLYKNIPKRSGKRMIGNIAGGALFAALYSILPNSVISLIGIIGGFGNALSTKYQLQAMFNSLGAMSIAVAVFGSMQGAVFYRIADNIIGAVYAILFGLVFHKVCAIIVKKTDAIKNTDNKKVRLK